jgi:hypothetical protein
MSDDQRHDITWAWRCAALQPQELLVGLLILVV